MAQQEIENIDDLARAIEEDEAKDKLELAAQGLAMMSAREYARARGIKNPQNVYYHIRRGRITESPCPCCGRKVIDVKEADAIFVKQEEDLSDGDDG